MKTKNVQQWLQSSQRNIPYELDFFTPFKDMVASEKPAPQSRHASKRKHTHSKSPHPTSPIIISSDEDKSSSSSTSSASSSQKYKRRPRHKTREDRYEYKGSKKHAAKKHKERSAEQPKEHKKQKKRVKKDVVDNFTARNVLSERLTLNKPGGIFQRGKASIPASRPALPDLQFSERAFLKLKRADGTGYDENEKENWNADARRVERKDKRQQDQDAKMSEYFRQLPPVRRAKDSAQTHAGADAAIHRPNIFQTPCPQRQASPELSSPPLIDVPLPGPAFLGFGEKGPAPVSKSSLRRTASLTPISESFHHGNKIHRKRVASADFEPASDFSRQDDTTASCTPDPRAKHSPTSNFAFAKAQQVRTQPSDMRPPHRRSSRQDDQIRQPDKQEEIMELLRELQKRQESNDMTRNKSPANEKSDDLKPTPRLSNEKEAQKLVEMLMDSSKVMSKEAREITLLSLSQIIESMQNKQDKDAAGKAKSTEDTSTSGRQSENCAPEAKNGGAIAPQTQDQYTPEGSSAESQGERGTAQDKVDPNLAPANEPETSTLPEPVNESHAESNTAMQASPSKEPSSRPETLHDAHRQYSDHDRTSLLAPSGLDQLPIHGGSHSRAGYASPGLFARPRLIQMTPGPGLYEQQTRGFARQGYISGLPISRQGTSSSIVRPLSRMRPQLFDERRDGLRRTAISPHQEWTEDSEMLNLPHNAYRKSYNSAPAQSEHPLPWKEISPARTYDGDIHMMRTGICDQTPSFAEVGNTGVLQYGPDSVDGLSSADYRFLDESDRIQPQTDSMITFSDVNATDLQSEYAEVSADISSFWRPHILY